jgi:Rrf2 family protein
MLSQTVEYALRATLYIAREPGRTVRVQEVADAVEAPQNYLSKILGALARSGILESTRGPSGGFRLAKDPADVSLADVVAQFENVDQRRCLLGNGICGQNPSCNAHARWAPIAERMDRFFDTTTLADLLSSTSSHPHDANAAWGPAVPVPSHLA